jgi:hypothetical protein
MKTSVVPVVKGGGAGITHGKNPIQFKIYVRNVHSIDIPKQTVEMSIWFEFFWYVDEEFKDDERKKYVTDDEEEKKVLNKKPRIRMDMFTNLHSEGEWLLAPKLKKEKNLEKYTNPWDTVVFYSCVIKGCFDMAFDLRSFPFDRQKFPLIMTLWDVPYHNPYSTDVQEERPNDSERPPPGEKELNKDRFHIVPLTIEGSLAVRKEHYVHGGTYALGSKMEFTEGLTPHERGWRHQTFYTFKLEIEAVRNPMSQMWNLVFPVFIIGSFSFVAPIVRPEEFDTRVSFISTNLLTIVALKFAASSALPVLGYNTILDQYIIAALALPVFLAIEAVAVRLMDHDDARQVDFFVSAMLVVFWLGMHVAIIIKAWRHMSDYRKHYKEGRGDFSRV